MSIAGYNFYLNGVKVNAALSASPTFTFDGLASDSGYSLMATAVDQAGNESPLSTALMVSTPSLPLGTQPLTAEQIAGVDAIITASMAQDNYPGVVLDITGPAGVYRKAYGNTPGGWFSSGRPVTIDDHFRMGSITKTFLACAAFIQIDQGKLNMRDVVSKYVPGIPNGNNITIENLMSMQSGIPDYTADFWFSVNAGMFPTAPISRDREMGLIRGSSSQFTPGTQFSYSNSNALLLGEILQNITGRNIRNIIIEDVITPLGLTETTWPTNSVVPAPAMSDSQWTPDWAREAGALTTTITDLTKWAQEMRDGTLLSADSHYVWTKQFWGVPLGGDSPPTSVGYGHFQMKWGRWVGHGGSHPGGFDSSCLFDPETGATITVGNNAQIASAPGFYVTSKEIAKLLYPGSMNDPVYTPPSPFTELQPGPALVSIAGAWPRVRVEPKDKVYTPGPVAVSVRMGIPGSTDVDPNPAKVAVAGPAPKVAMFTPPVFDSFASSTTYAGRSAQLDHVVTHSNSVLIVDVLGQGTPQAVTLDGAAFTPVLTVTFPGGSLRRYIKTGVATGTRKVFVDFGAGNYPRTALTSVAYHNVDTVGETTSTVISEGSSPSQSVLINGTQVAVQTFGEISGAGFATWSGGTNRGRQGVGDAGGYLDILVNEAPFASTTFTATGPSTMNWASIATVLNGKEL